MIITRLLVLGAFVLLGAGAPGVPARDRNRFRAWSNALVAPTPDPALRGIEVLSRTGLDLNPLDPGDEEDFGFGSAAFIIRTAKTQ